MRSAGGGACVRGWGCPAHYFLLVIFILASEFFHVALSHDPVEWGPWQPGKATPRPRFLAVYHFKETDSWGLWLFWPSSPTTRPPASLKSMCPLLAVVNNNKRVSLPPLFRMWSKWGYKQMDCTKLSSSFPVLSLALSSEIHAFWSRIICNIYYHWPIPGVSSLEGKGGGTKLFSLNTRPSTRNSSVLYSMNYQMVHYIFYQLSGQLARKCVCPGGKIN